MAPSTSLQRASPRNLLTSLVLVFPIFIVYQVGVLFTLPMLNGADFLTTFLFRNLGLSVSGYLLFTAGATLVFALTVAVLRRTQRFDGRVVIPVLLESSFYALTMGSLISVLMSHILHISPHLAAGIESQGGIGRLVMSLGAGVYEETVFRLLLLSSLAAVFEKAVGLGRRVAVLLAFAMSALAFSAMHHIPPYGEPLRFGVFTFRFLAGLFFGVLFWFRGFAVAVYSHVCYDVYVLLIR